jgi:hypothetical protein
VCGNGRNSFCLVWWHSVSIYWIRHSAMVSTHSVTREADFVSSQASRCMLSGMRHLETGASSSRSKIQLGLDAVTFDGHVPITRHLQSRFCRVNHKMRSRQIQSKFHALGCRCGGLEQPVLNCASFRSWGSKVGTRHAMVKRELLERATWSGE